MFDVELLLVGLVCMLEVYMGGSYDDVVSNVCICV